jgi:serine O-acetyltransferase
MSTEFIRKLYERNSSTLCSFPDKRAVAAFIDRLFEFLFLPAGIQQKTEWQLVREFEKLKIGFSEMLFDYLQDDPRTHDITRRFFSAIPALHEQLIHDAESILHYDPAAETLEEVLVSYPGFYATTVYRFAHELYKYELPILPRLFTEYAHSKTGIDIHPGATIGNPFFIDHGTGIVIGETTIIGNNVKLYQGVTLGALNVAKELSEIKRHPTIEDNVVIYAGSTILGGETVVGRDSIIGGNVWLTNSVPSNSVVYHKSEITVKDMYPLNEIALNFVI